LMGHGLCKLIRLHENEPAHSFLLLDGGMLPIEALEDVRHLLSILETGSFGVAPFDTLESIVVFGADKVFSHDSHYIIIVV